MSAIKRFKVSLCRVEHTLYEFNIRAYDEESAQKVAWQLYNSGQDADSEDVVHAEEFTHQVEEINHELECGK